jgi:hypothetical protein
VAISAITKPCGGLSCATAALWRPQCKASALAVIHNIEAGVLRERHGPEHEHQYQEPLHQLGPSDKHHGLWAANYLYKTAHAKKAGQSEVKELTGVGREELPLVAILLRNKCVYAATPENGGILVARFSRSCGNIFPIQSN